jgi:hypothetical protein
VDFRKNSEGICGLHKLRRHLWNSERIHKASFGYRKIQKVFVAFRKDSEGIRGPQKGLRRNLWASERVQTVSVDFRKDSEAICGLQKGLTHQLHQATEKKHWKKS